ncbi:hypothetical protein BDP55DRAFT_681551 [Colletotrichum godetiae]|uniref:Uncharacterized protein n=1 Tax=Colletotrichum godetiae TaxID=1209918 RepID=A0AAJ0ADE2_9PEZI|nr:uncharacterized protein BDP55DRAFT_681551 [Colletotrichum godetiae]KAK1658870.1 hypothetical protein BDP55DRAFT_681551 [Colletotrichum godetiae]
MDGLGCGDSSGLAQTDDTWVFSYLLVLLSLFARAAQGSQSYLDPRFWIPNARLTAAATTLMCGRRTYANTGTNSQVRHEREPHRLLNLPRQAHFLRTSSEAKGSERLVNSPTDYHAMSPIRPSPSLSRVTGAAYRTHAQELSTFVGSYWRM